MRFLRLLRPLLAAVTLISAAAGAFAVEPKNGVDYLTLDAAARPETGKKIEVIEFFMYQCPHCNRLEPLISDWVKKQGENIVFHRVHLAFSGPNDPQAHAYATLEAMGKLEGIHQKIFNAIHVDHLRLSTDEALLDFAVKNGIDKKQYLEFFNSFAVQTKMKRGSQLTATDKIDSAPSLVVNGHYVTSPTLAGRPGQAENLSQIAALQVLDVLVQKSQKDNGVTPVNGATIKTVKK